jgi:hypothetical protein
MGKNAEVKKNGSYNSSPLYAFMWGTGENLPFSLYLFTFLLPKAFK